MITPERAAQIKKLAEEKAKDDWMNHLYQVITLQEKAYILSHWRALPASATIADAFHNFLTGNVGEAG